MAAIFLTVSAISCSEIKGSSGCFYALSTLYKILMMSVNIKEQS